MNRAKLIATLVVLGVVTFVSMSAIYTVGEVQQVIITQFGKPVGDAITEPGIRFKIPFIQEAHFFDKRYMEWDGDPNQVPTKDKKFIFVDAYARWQITDPLQFFKRLTNERGAQSRLDDILDGETRDFIANHNLEEAVRTSNRQPAASGIIGELIGDSLAEIQVGRERIQDLILVSAGYDAHAGPRRRDAEHGTSRATCPRRPDRHARAWELVSTRRWPSGGRW